ncbi:MAG: hypothetical protein P4L42_00700 [Desulfocapsaceae bacterium]|nr:hypothetical protein [Desulfocapsaceae bacterium]
MFEQEVACIKDKNRSLRLLSGRLYLVRLSGQTAQLIGMSAAAFNFATDLARIEETQLVMSERCPWQEDQENGEKQSAIYQRRSGENEIGAFGGIHWSKNWNLKKSERKFVLGVLKKGRARQGCGSHSRQVLILVKYSFS